MKQGYMVIDVGSNTVKYGLFRERDSRLKLPVEYGGDSVTLRLLQFVEEGALREEGFYALCDVLSDFRRKAAEEGIANENVLAFATAGIRRLREPEAVLRRLRERTGVTVRLLSGQEEATLSFLGMNRNVRRSDVNQGIMLDMGGGSTEAVFFQGKKILDSCSLPFGALSLQTRFVQGEFPTEEEAKAVRQFVAQTAAALNIVSLPAGSRQAYLVGGTAKATGCMHAYLLGKKPSVRCHMNRSTFLRQLDSYLTVESARECLKDHYPQRWQAVITGMLAFDELFLRLHIRHVQITDGSLRLGYIRHHLQEKSESKGRPPLENG